VNCPICGRMGIREWEGWTCIEHGPYWDWTGKPDPAIRIVGHGRKPSVKLPGSRRSNL